MQRILGAIAALTLAAGVAAPAAAQNAADARSMRFGVQGGLSVPMGDDGDVLESGFTVGGLLDFMPAALPVGIRFNLDYTRWGAKVGDESASVISGTAAAMYTVPTTGGVSPYVLGGVGMYRGDCSADECEGETDFGFNLGGGVNFNLGTLGTFAEVRYHNVDGSSWLPVVFGIRF